MMLGWWHWKTVDARLAAIPCPFIQIPIHSITQIVISVQEVTADGEAC